VVTLRGEPRHVVIHYNMSPHEDSSRSLKIAHLLYYTPPAMSGYAIRSRYILQEQRKRCLEVFAVSHPVMSRLGGREREELEGIPYIRLQRRGSLVDRARNRLFLKDGGIVRAIVSELLPILAAETPDILHAHTPHIMGRVGIACGRSLGIPVVYEARGLWEDSGAVRGAFTRSSRRYRVFRDRETEAFRSADHVVTISEGLRRDLEQRGVPSRKIDIVPNGASPPERLPEPNAELARRYGLHGKTVVGYVGSLSKIEGLELLVEAFAKLVPDSPDVRLLFVGDGPIRPDLQQQARALGIADRVIFTGNVPHEEIWSYYMLLDVLVVCRPSNRVSEIVTPIKPLEAMGLGRALLVSCVGGLMELIREDRTGMSFPAGDVGACTESLGRLIRDRGLRERLGREARRWILDEWAWPGLVGRYDAIYTRLLATHHSHSNQDAGSKRNVSSAQDAGPAGNAGSTHDGGQVRES
jgi:PEP-CTERM/exosortase A-associated glycosyltransferase